MVRINLINPRKLADQHLVAEYDEILMLLGYVRRYPSAVGIPDTYCLGPGHIKFFKNKLRYLKNRHEELKKEMRLRGFKPTKNIKLSEFPIGLRGDWKPTVADKKIILARLRSKIRAKPGYYRYYGEKKSQKFLLKLLI